MIQQQPLKAFCVYTQNDLPLWEELCCHLSVLQRQGLITSWYIWEFDGETELEEVSRALADAEVILLFMNSKFVSAYQKSNKVREMMEMGKKGAALVFPILSNNVTISLPFFKHLTFFPSRARTLISWKDREEALCAQTRYILLLARSYQAVRSLSEMQRLNIFYESEKTARQRALSEWPEYQMRSRRQEHSSYAEGRNNLSNIHSKQPSEIQQYIYDFIVMYIEREGKSPTMREISNEVQNFSISRIDYHLTMLEKKGLIERQFRKSRGIKLTTKPTGGIPITGMIAAGEPLDIFFGLAQTVGVDLELVEKEKMYALIVKGHSMIEDHICDGDYVVIKPQNTCQNGDIIVAVHMQEGISGSAILKRFYQEKDHDHVRLQPTNAELEPILIPQSVWDHEWQIIGRVITLIRYTKQE